MIIAVLSSKQYSYASAKGGIIATQQMDLVASHPLAAIE